MSTENGVVLSIPELPPILPINGEIEVQLHARKHYTRLDGKRTFERAVDEHIAECWAPRRKAEKKAIRKRDKEEMRARWHRWAEKFEWRIRANEYDEAVIAEERESAERAIQDEYDRKARLGLNGLMVLERSIQRMLDNGNALRQEDIPRWVTTFFGLRQEGLEKGREDIGQPKTWEPSPDFLQGVEIRVGTILQTINIGAPAASGPSDSPDEWIIDDPGEAGVAPTDFDYANDPELAPLSKTQRMRALRRRWAAQEAEAVAGVAVALQDTLQHVSKVP